jgi:predicted nucleic acid-binding protein
LSEYVLDASVAVASLRPNEPGHTAAKKRLGLLLTGSDTIVVPAIFGIEVASALARVGFPPADARRFADAFVSRGRLVTIGPRAARATLELAVQARLRAADALYLWVAMKEGLPLITADQELLKRGSAVWSNIALP